MIKISEQEHNIVLKYEPDYTQRNWIKKEFQNNQHIYLAKRSFLLGQTDLIETVEDTNSEVEYYLFLLGVLKNDYFKINKEILELDNDLFLHVDLKIDKKTFLAANNISIFSKIDELVSEPMIIGGDKDNAVPVDEFISLQKTFPTSTTLQYYAQSRVSKIIKSYLQTTTDAEFKLEEHYKRQQKIATNLIEDTKERPLIKVESLRVYELEKYQYIKSSVELMGSFYPSISINTYGILRYAEHFLNNYPKVYKNFVALVLNEDLTYSKTYAEKIECSILLCDALIEDFNNRGYIQSESELTNGKYIYKVTAIGKRYFRQFLERGED